MLLNTLEEDPKLEDMYCEWLEENCKCDIEEDGCGCLDFDVWFKDRQEDAVWGIEDETA